MKCIACDNELPTKRGFANDKGRTGKLACQLTGCPSHGIKQGSKEYKIVVMGWSELDVDAYWLARGRKSADTMKANGHFDNPANNPFSKAYWIKRGLTDDEAAEKVKSRAGKSTSTKRDAGFYDDPANNPYSYEFGIKQGLSPDEARARINAKNHNCPEYWVKRGSTEEEAVELAYKRASINSLQARQEKYGEADGIASYNATRLKMASSWSTRSMAGRNFASSEQADHLFSRLYKFIRRLGYSRDDVQCNLNRGELFIRSENGIYFYDFVLRPLKLIIEFNGEHVHPNPDMSVGDWCAWRHAFNKKSADVVASQDKIKLSAAEDLGYNTMVVWSKDPANYEIAINFIKEKHNEYQSNQPQC